MFSRTPSGSAREPNLPLSPDRGITLYLQPHVEGGLDLGNLARYLVQQKFDQFVDG